MQRNYTRRQVVQARVQIDEFQEAVMILFVGGIAFLDLIRHIFQKTTLPI